MNSYFIEINIPGNRLHHLSEIVAEIWYNAHNYYDEDKAEKVRTLVERLFNTIESVIKEHPEYRTSADPLPGLTIGEISRAMADSVLEFGNLLCAEGDFIDSLHNVPIDVRGTLQCFKAGVRRSKIVEALSAA